MSAQKDHNSLTAVFFQYFEKKSNSDLKQTESFLINHVLLQEFQKKINYQFKNKALLLQAVTHPSFAHEFCRNQMANNEVLEFLGDSILGAVIAISITDFFKELNEGQLSKIKSSLVSEEPLFELSNLIGLDRVLLVGRGEFLGNGTNRSSNLSSALEAVVAAIFLDAGFSAAQRFLENIIELYGKCNGKPYISMERIEFFDAKSKLQELTMKKYKTLPEYHATQNVDQSFTVELFINQKFINRITDMSKKRAQKLLAQMALDHLTKEGE